MVLCVLIVLFSLAGVHIAFAAPVSVRGRKQNKLTMVQFSVRKLRAAGAGGTVRWFSSDKSVATVSKRGKVKAVSAGNCVIFAKRAGRRYSCRLTVNPLSLSESSVTLIAGRQRMLSLNNRRLAAVYTSLAPAVASVDDTGKIEANQPGEAIITAQYKEYRFTCTVTVLRASFENCAAAYDVSKANRGKVVLAGSSSMDYWNFAAEAFAPYDVINTAIAGSTVTQWLSWFPVLIARYKPSAVVLSIGSNDIAYGVSGRQNAENTVQLLKILKKRLKKTPVFFVSICPCWLREGDWEEIALSNSLVREYCESQTGLYYIALDNELKAADGTPDPRYFRKDRLHPSAEGYAVWRTSVAKHVCQVLGEAAEEDDGRQKKMTDNGRR